jgi:hypothetical protein
MAYKQPAYDMNVENSCDLIDSIMRNKSQQV